ARAGAGNRSPPRRRGPHARRARLLASGKARAKKNPHRAAHRHNQRHRHALAVSPRGFEFRQRKEDLLMIALALAAAVASSSARPILITVDDLPIAADDLHTSEAERLQITKAMLA